jgi:hypothetical protein
MPKIHTTSFIQRHILQKSGQFLLQKSEVRLSCTRHFDEPFRNAPLTIKTVNYCTPHAITCVPRLSLIRHNRIYKYVNNYKFVGSKIFSGIYCIKANSHSLKKTL